MSDKIDWIGYHRVILEDLKDETKSFDKLQDNTFLTNGSLASILGGLFAMKCVYSPRLGYFSATHEGLRYLASISTSERRTPE